jgi:hypothetical protein
MFGLSDSRHSRKTLVTPQMPRLDDTIESISETLLKEPKYRDPARLTAKSIALAVTNPGIAPTKALKLGETSLRLHGFAEDLAGEPVPTGLHEDQAERFHMALAARMTADVLSDPANRAFFEQANVDLEAAQNWMEDRADHHLGLLAARAEHGPEIDFSA